LTSHAIAIQNPQQNPEISHSKLGFHHGTENTEKKGFVCPGKIPGQAKKSSSFFKTFIHARHQAACRAEIQFL
jgi:hypothetical protein